jgi:hypothetical protein
MAAARSATDPAAKAAALATFNALMAAYSGNSSADPPQDVEDKKSSAEEKEKEKEANQEDGLEDEQEITYTPYRPKKLKYGRNHPDPVVENSTLGSVEPPDITYNLVMPADIIAEGKLSNLQLEAVVYGCQAHMRDLPSASVQSSKENVQPVKSEGGSMVVGMDLPQEPIDEPVPVRAGFLLGDGAGMGKGRTLAGFVVENIARGRKKHIWISVR